MTKRYRLANEVDCTEEQVIALIRATNGEQFISGWTGKKFQARSKPNTLIFEVICNKRPLDDKDITWKELDDAGNPKEPSKIKEHDVIPSITAQISSLLSHSRTLRYLLFMHHGCSGPALYGDDGEMQCNACNIDFVRNSIEQIQQRFTDIGNEKLSKLPKCDKDCEHQHFGLCFKKQGTKIKCDHPTCDNDAEIHLCPDHYDGKTKLICEKNKPII